MTAHQTIQAAYAVAAGLATGLIGVGIVRLADAGPKATIAAFLISLPVTWRLTGAR